MNNSKIIDENLLSNYSSSNTVAEKAKGLITQQRENWPLAKSNYYNFSDVEKKTFEFDHFKIVVQFNPGRFVSSSAKVDADSIENRPCFLCVDNLPPEQKGLIYKSEYIILVNPFPIFEEHFTIPTLKHQLQNITNSFTDMLDLAKDLGKYYSIFYNGPKCGASAPDHLHFQACIKDIMPIENELNKITSDRRELFYENTDANVYGINNYLRNFFLITSDKKDSAILQFNNLQTAIKKIFAAHDEPMMNVIVLFDETWKVLVFPRAKHRSTQYFLEGNDKLLISPAAVDFGGQLITPREEDFNKVTKNDIKNIFIQTSISENIFRQIGNSYSALASKQKG